MFSVKKRIILDSIILVGVLLAVTCGCSRVTRHKVLTFFFEGVPPLDADKRAAIAKATVAEPVDVELVKIVKQTRASGHKPGRDCSQCHQKIGGRSRNRLIRSLPDLCYKCHTDYSASRDYLHGPIAAGDCVVCHDPHRSRYIHLQRAPQPDLCYQCHLQEDIGSIADHRDEQHQICSECHDPHMGSTRNLLKSQPELPDGPDSADLSE